MERDDPSDSLRRLEERLDRASDAAERLLAEAAGSATRAARAATEAVKLPPSGWQLPREDAVDRSDLDAIVEFVRSLRDLIPPELQQRLAEALRELLTALRALIDWYLERSERGRTEAKPVEDIPIL